MMRRALRNADLVGSFANVLYPLRSRLVKGTPLCVSGHQVRLASATPYPRPVSPLSFDLHSPASPKADEKTAPIIFLHGLFGSKKNNRGISKVKDLRNHGESPHDPRHDYAAMAEDILAFIDSHGLKEPTLIGHSMGAKTAMSVALRSPETVARVVAVDNAPVDVALSRTFASYVRGMKRIQEANVTRQAEADAILRDYEESLPIRQFLLGNLYRSPEDGIQRFCVPLDILGRSLDHLGDFPYKNPGEARYTKPSLFVRGTQSKYVPDDVLPIIGQFFPRFRLADVDAGHWLISEQPEAFRQGRFLLLAFQNITSGFYSLTHMYLSRSELSARSIK
ncbi:glycosyltransferase family 41 protein [Trichoderma cornu-damae]|uniref:Glycosyltransferase family 41 protein n=1 Tax=Trichoderma cornu-damae TaxID=654480 RepID=A0A9P8QII3_9HYPO|nr:glycosyltransferase family 41 protein [Trichoderma cornu-damae]